MADILRRGFKAEAERFALSLRAEIGLKVTDRLDPIALAAHLEIPVISLPELRLDGASGQSVSRLMARASGFSALTICEGTRRLIVYNPQHAKTRRANSLVHEVGHIVLEHPPAPALSDGGCRHWNAQLEAEADWQAGTLLVPRDGGKERLLLTGILDLVVQQQNPLHYKRVWQWSDKARLEGEVHKVSVRARVNDLEIWDYKGTRGDSPDMRDYVLQLLTYANLYRERTGKRPQRCILFFTNEKKRDEQLVAIPLEDDLLNLALAWTIDRVKDVQKTMRAYQTDPCAVDGGDYVKNGQLEVSDSLSKQCTACGERFDCQSYRRRLGGSMHPDVDLLNVKKN